MYITEALEISEETSNPVYKLTTDKLQPLLINVVTRSIFEHKGFTR